MPGATVMRTKRWGGRPVRKLVVTSANFSKSAEQFNIELGLVITDPLVTQSIESQLIVLGQQGEYESGTTA